VSRAHLSLVIDEALSKARAERARSTDEAHAIKTAEEAPRSELAKAIKALASEIKIADFEVTYNDIVIESAP
jgi:multidrug resistance efflux pump